MMRLIAGLCMTLLASASFALPIVSLNPSSTSLAPNESFSVDVLLSGVEVTDPLLAFGFDVDTGAGLRFNGATIAAMFFDDSDAFATTDVGGSAFPAVSGEGILLATLSLTAGFTPGLWDIALTSTGSDFGVSEGLFTLSETFALQAGTAVEVVGGTAVPLPSSVLLVVLGLLLLPRQTVAVRLHSENNLPTKLS